MFRRHAAVACLVALAALATGCGRRAASGPAWPRSAGRVEVAEWSLDGGESLEPRAKAQGVSEVERADDRANAASAAETKVDAAKPAERPAADAGEERPSSDGARTETIELEVEDLQLTPDEIIIVEP